MNLSNVVESDDTLRRVFSWQTRLGIAPKFGCGVSIHHYQMSQFESIGDIERAAKQHRISLMNVRAKGGQLVGVGIDTGKVTPFALIVRGKVVAL